MLSVGMNKTDDDEEQPGTSTARSDNEDSSMEKIRKYLAQKLNLSDDSSADDVQDKPKKKILNNLNLDGIVEYIKENNCKKIITMAGAGISTCKYFFFVFILYLM